MSAGVAYALVTLPPSIQRGDILIATSTSQLIRVATGTAGSVLSVVNNIPAWVATSTLGITGSGTVTSVDASVPTGLSVSGVPFTTSGTIAISLQAGYNIPLTASTTEWSGFYNAPSSRITAGANLSWSGNTLTGTMASSTIIAGGTATHSPSVTFATSTDTNLLLSIFCATSTCTFNPSWTGVLGLSRGGIATTTLGNLTVSSSNLSITGGQQVLIGTSTVITLTSTPTFGNATFTGITSLASTSLTGTLTVSGSTTLSSLSASACDVKSTTGGNLYCGTDATGAGGGITSLNGLTADPQSFAVATSGGLSLLISSVTDTHTFTLAPYTGYSVPLTASTTEWALALQTKLSTTTAAATYPTFTYASSSYFHLWNVVGTSPIVVATSANPTISCPSCITSVSTLVPYSYASTSYFTLWNTQAGANITITTSSNPTIAVVASPAFTNGTFSGTLGVTATSTFATVTTPSLYVSNLTSGNCVQASTGGFLTTAAAPCGSGGGNSAWTIGSALIHNATTTDSVLVGTTTPTTAKLFVQGSGSQLPLRIASSTGTTLFTIDTFGTTTIANLTAASCDVKSTTGGSLYCGTDANNGGTAQWLMGSGLIYNATSTDEVGIGTSTPLARLHVVENVTTSTADILRLDAAPVFLGNYMNVFDSAGTNVLNLDYNRELSVNGNIDTNTYYQFNDKNFLFGVVGDGQLHGATELDSTYLGDGAGTGWTGNDNTFLGYSVANTSGSSSYNTIIGSFAADSLDDGADKNVIVGASAGVNISGDSNILLGYSVGQTGTQLTSGSNNIMIGDSIDAGLGARTGAITIGYQLQATTDNQLKIGSLLTGTNIYSSGKLGINSSTPIATLSVGGVGGTNPFIIATSTGAPLFTIKQTGDIEFGKTAIAQIYYIQPETNSVPGIAGNDIWLQSGGGTATSTGGSVYIFGSLGGTSGGNGGLIQIGSGTALANNANGGNVVISSGGGNGTGSGGNFSFSGGQGGGSAGGTGGAFSLLGGSGGTSGGTGGSITLTGGNGRDTYSPGSVILKGGTSQDGTAIAGANVYLYGGAGGSSGNANGGNVILMSGTRLNSGVVGKVGINSTSPTAILTVQGTSTGPTLPIFIVSSSTGVSQFQVASNGSTTVANLTASDCDVKSTTAGSLFCGTDGGTLSGGTVGKVTVWSSASALTTGVLLDNGTVAGVNATSSTVSFNIQGTTTLNPFNVSSSTGISLLRVNVNGSVAVGTTTNTSTLFVQGTSTQPTLTLLDVASSTGTSFLQVTAQAQILACTTCRLTIPQGAAPTLSAAGDIAHDTTNDQLLYGATPNVLTATSTKGMMIELPTASESLTMMTVLAPITITRVECIITSSVSNVPSWTFSLPHSTSRASGSANAMTAGQACTSTTSPQSITIGGDLTLAAGEVLWATSSAVSNASTTLIQIYYKYDRQ